MAEYKILDVSCHNGIVDFTQVKKAGYTGVILRAGFGKSITQKDKCFQTYYKDAKLAGLNVGAYWYSYSKTSSEALLEAKTFLQAIKDCQLELPCYYDIEDKTQIPLGKTVCTEMANTFCKYLEDNKYWAGVYSYDSFFGSNLDISIQSRYAIWVARVDGRKPQFCKTYQGWQNSWVVKIPNHTCDFDSSIFTVDYSNLIKSRKLNGFGKVIVVNTTTPIIKPIQVIKDINNFYDVPSNIKLYNDCKDNVINIFSYKTQGNIKLSDHFSVKEFASISGNKIYTDEVLIHNKLIELLEGLYAKLNCSKIIVNSGYRTPQHEIDIGGNKTGVSRHTQGRAADCVCYGKDNKPISAKIVCCALEDMGVLGIGYISANDISVHCDTRTIKFFEIEYLNKSINSFHEYFKM